MTSDKATNQCSKDTDNKTFGEILKGNIPFWGILIESAAYLSFPFLLLLVDSLFNHAISSLPFIAALTSSPGMISISSSPFGTAILGLSYSLFLGTWATKRFNDRLDAVMRNRIRQHYRKNADHHAQSSKEEEPGRSLSLPNGINGEADNHTQSSEEEDSLSLPYGIKGWFIGAVERMFFTPLVAWNVGGAGIAMIAWITVKYYTFWKKRRLEPGKSGNTKQTENDQSSLAVGLAFKSLLSGLVSMFFALIGGLIWRWEIIPRP